MRVRKSKATDADYNFVLNKDKLIDFEGVQELVDTKNKEHCHVAIVDGRDHATH